MISGPSRILIIFRLGIVPCQKTLRRLIQICEYMSNDLTLMDINFMLPHSGGHTGTSHKAKGKERAHSEPPEDSASSTSLSSSPSLDPLTEKPWIKCPLEHCEFKSIKPQDVYRHIRESKVDKVHKGLTEAQRNEMQVEVRVLRPGRRGTPHFTPDQRRIALQIAERASGKKKKLLLYAGRYLV